MTLTTDPVKVKDFFLPIIVVDEKKIRKDVAFSETFIISGEGMIFVLLWKDLWNRQSVDHILYSNEIALLSTGLLNPFVTVKSTGP